eukprot:1181624-Prorocentrum_minimum.AAC.2
MGKATSASAAQQREYISARRNRQHVLTRTERECLTAFRDLDPLTGKQPKCKCFVLPNSQKHRQIRRADLLASVSGPTGDADSSWGGVVAKEHTTCVHHTRCAVLAQGFQNSFYSTCLSITLYPVICPSVCILRDKAPALLSIPRQGT